jgi:hypothetical protein
VYITHDLVGFCLACLKMKGTVDYRQNSKSGERKTEQLSDRKEWHINLAQKLLNPKDLTLYHNIKSRQNSHHTTVPPCKNPQGVFRENPENTRVDVAPSKGWHCGEIMWHKDPRLLLRITPRNHPLIPDPNKIFTRNG